MNVLAPRRLAVIVIIYSRNVHVSRWFATHAKITAMLVPANINDKSTNN